MKLLSSQILFKAISSKCNNVRKIATSATILNQLNNQPSSVSHDPYDIIISGGGMVGFATACALGQNPRLADKKILLLEKQPNRNWSLPDEFSNRVCSLNSQTQQLFLTIGVWDIIKKHRVQKVKKMQVWESCSEAMITFEDFNSEDGVSYIIENDVILDALKQKIPQNVEVSYSTHATEFHLPSSCEDSVQISLHDGRKVTTDLLVGADGVHSGVKKAMGTRSVAWDYDQMGIVATLKFDEEQDNSVAWQKFISTGPIALLPLSTTRSSLVWSTTKEKAATLLAMSDDEFVDELNNALWQDEPAPQIVRDLHDRWLGILDTVCPLFTGRGGSQGLKQLPQSISGVVPKTKAAFPLGLAHAAHYVAPRVVLVGDAAHRVHPLAGQGVNLGFGDVVCLRDTLSKAVLAGADIGDFEHLRDYESSRQAHNVSLLVATDALYRLYSTRWLPAVLARSFGLSTVDAITPLKNRIMAHAGQ